MGCSLFNNPGPPLSPNSVHPPPTCDHLPTVQHFAQRQMFADLSYARYPYIVGQHQGACVVVVVGCVGVGVYCVYVALVIFTARPSN